MTFQKFILFLFCSAAYGSCIPTANAGPIDAVLESAVKDGQIPGVIAIAATPDEILYSGSAGMRDVSSNSEMTIDTIVHIASMTKAVTSVATMQLIEQGKIGLDRPIEDYLSQFSNAQVLEGFTNEDKPILRAAKSPVTIRQLLSHTSGYVYEAWNRNAKKNAELEATSSISDGVYDHLYTPLAFDPGARWEYGISTDILGVLIETVSGQALDEYFQERIFSPLGMSDTSFRVPDDKVTRLATRYFKSADGKMSAIPYSQHTGDFFSGGGGLRSTAIDYVRFLQTIMNGGALGDARILDQETVELMAQNQIGDLEVADSIISFNPGWSNDIQIWPESVEKFGLGFLINGEPIPGGRSAGSLSWSGLFNTYFWVDREKGICGVLMTQILPYGDVKVLELFNQFETAVYSMVKEIDGN